MPKIAARLFVLKKGGRFKSLNNVGFLNYNAVAVAGYLSLNDVRFVNYNAVAVAGYLYGGGG